MATLLFSRNGSIVGGFFCTATTKSGRLSAFAGATTDTPKVTATESMPVRAAFPILET